MQNAASSPVEESLQSAADRVTHAARLAMPLAWQSRLERLETPILRSVLADAVHLLMPLMVARPDRAAQALAASGAALADPQQQQKLCAAIGLTHVRDAMHNIEPTPLASFQRFAAAIGTPPSLGGLTQAEELVRLASNRLSSLCTSARPGVALAALAVFEQVLDWTWRHLGNLIQHRAGLVPPVAAACFAPERRDAAMADHCRALLMSLPPEAMLSRNIAFGCQQSHLVGRDLAALLDGRAARLDS